MSINFSDGIILNNINFIRELNVIDRDNTDKLLSKIILIDLEICKYLTNNKMKVKKLIFVSGFNNYLGINEDYDAVNGPMYFDTLEDIKNYCDDIVCFYSDNDPYVKYEVEKSFADTISNKQYLIPNGGHINAETGYTKFEEILKEL